MATEEEEEGHGLELRPGPVGMQCALRDISDPDNAISHGYYFFKKILLLMQFMYCKTGFIAVSGARRVDRMHM